MVNGCQTCHVLFDERDRLTDDVQLSIRVVHSEDEAVIAGIIAATNRQTAVSEEDLSAREDFHMKLEDWFGAQPPDRKLYYERRSKQYASRTDVEKTRVISRSQLTKAYAAMFLGEPAAVGHYRDLTERRRDELFQEGQLPDPYYVAASAHYRIEWLLRTRRIRTQLRPARFSSARRTAVARPRGRSAGQRAQTGRGTVQALARSTLGRECRGTCLRVARTRDRQHHRSGTGRRGPLGGDGS